MRSTPPYLMEQLHKKIQTIGSDANPKMEIAVSRSKTTVTDGDYWTSETIRNINGLGDISLAPRRFLPYGPPNRIYEIHVRDGIVSTSIREYPDKLNSGWVDQFVLGPGENVGLAFDGHWVQHRNTWRLVTDEKPWIFWVDNQGVLWGQHWDDPESKIELSTGVNFVTSIRGWKNTVIDELDQGIIVGYIKTDGTVWYRNYCIQPNDIIAWEYEKQLVEFVGSALSLNMMIANDYRMGFIVESSTNEISWYITNRNWGGMAVGPENVTAAITDINFSVLPVTYHDTYDVENITTGISNITFDVLYASLYNSFVSLENIANDLDDWGRIITIEVEQELFSVPTISIYDIVGAQELPVGIITMVDSRHLIVTINDASEIGMNNAEDIRVTISSVMNEAGYTFDTFEETFAPINLVPTAIPLPEVEVIYNE